ncbi:hypothetical protein OTK49_03205 [Vibrio coralliirubri]|uniref:hypothetical protein n=1 Tax=Vibrio coralliirubri TaxID=1516159 RepID=UPI0022851515|nr:hypothetical protein [Vibrio coralliirubri]MCY9861524.1 hypothetical protein [Vibrio coralliirubri]
MSNEGNPSWELLKQIATANNRGNYDEVYALIDANDFTNKAQAADAAMLCIELTQDSVATHKACLVKFVKQATGLELSFRSAFRFNLLSSMLDDEHNESTDSKTE